MLETILFVVCLAADQWTKHWAATTLPALPGGTMPIIPNVLHLTYIENTGAAFGILQNQRPFFIAITCLAMLAIVGFWFVKRKSLGTWMRVALAFMLTGALGNFADRLRLHYVRDFVDFRLINFAVFNVADACLTTAVIMVAIYVFFLESKEKKAMPHPHGETPGSEKEAAPER